MDKDFFIRANRKLLRINSRDIYIISADSKYTRIITSKDSYLVNTSLNTLEEMLCPADFCRVHRAYIVAIPHISSVSTSTVYMHEAEIPLARAYRKKLLSRLEVIW